MRKEILCPICRCRIMDSYYGVQTDLAIHQPPEGYEALKPTWKPDYLIKCWKCKALIALRRTY